MKCLLLITLLTATSSFGVIAAATPHSSFALSAVQCPVSAFCFSAHLPLASTIPGPTNSSAADKVSGRDHLDEMARLKGASTERSQASFIDLVLIPSSIILALILLVRRSIFI